MSDQTKLEQIEERYTPIHRIGAASLPPAVLRGLGDRSQDKRKQAAGEVITIVSQWVQRDEMMRVDNVIDLLSNEFVNSKSVTQRKGGLTALAGAALGLMHRLPDYLSHLVTPIVLSFTDEDSRVCYFAAEAIYNIAKVARSDILICLPALFAGLCQLINHEDISVKRAVTIVDNLLKDIATEADNLNVDGLMPLIHHNLQSTKEDTKALVLSWINVLDNVLDVNMPDFVEDLLSELFAILDQKNVNNKASVMELLDSFLGQVCKVGMRNHSKLVTILVNLNSSKGRLLRFSALRWLHELLKGIGEDIKTQYPDILISILRSYAYCEEDPYTEEGILPRDAEEQLRQTTHSSRGSPSFPFSGNTNHGENIISHTYSTIPFTTEEHASMIGGDQDSLSNSPYCVNFNFNSIVDVDVERDLATETNHLLQCLVKKHLKFIPVDRLLNVIVSDMGLMSSHGSARMLGMRWIATFLDAQANSLNPYLNELFEPLLENLLHETDAVALLNIETIARVIMTSDENFKRMLSALVEKFLMDPTVLEKRGAFCIRRLCELLDEEAIYRYIAQQLSQYLHEIMTVQMKEKETKMQTKLTTEIDVVSKHSNSNIKTENISLLLKNNNYDSNIINLPDLETISIFTYILNLVLLTVPEMGNLRNRVRQSMNRVIGLSSESNSQSQSQSQSREDCELPSSLFAVLYNCWCCHTISAFSLCLLGRSYTMAAALIQRAKTKDVSVGFISHGEKLLDMLDTPVFVHIRLDILNPECNQAHLLDALYGLLMALPMSTAYTHLSERLFAICESQSLVPTDNSRSKSTQKSHKNVHPQSNEDTNLDLDSRVQKEIDKLLAYFDQIQDLNNMILL
jgi:hypothetical protein